MYRALYRKWRPQRFEDVVGQRAIVTALKNQITAGRVGHAYLFTGVRGTGKTTCAKIFAKAVNCLHPQGGDPCGECEVCRGIDNGSILDVVEMDAASNNGVDDIRDLRDETAYTPSACRYKVYIIDEVHMLSTAAFNALLKTLEEPPAHVIFILATTEIQKVPATILSRCQRYDFTRIGPEDIAGRVAYIAGQEGLRLTQGGADLIARLADGALRDALSILDTCAGVTADIDEDVVRRMAGVTDRSYLFRISDAVAARDGVTALAELAELRQRSVDVKRLSEELIAHYRSLLLAALPGGRALLSGVSPEEEKLYLDKAAQVGQSESIRAIRTLGNALERMTRGNDQRIELELALFSLTEPPLQQPAAVSVVSEAQSAQRPAVQPFASAPAVAPAAKPFASAPVRTQEPPVPAAVSTPVGTVPEVVPAAVSAPAETVREAAPAAVSASVEPVPEATPAAVQTPPEQAPAPTEEEVPLPEPPPADEVRLPWGDVPSEPVAGSPSGESIASAPVRAQELSAAEVPPDAQLAAMEPPPWDGQPVPAEEVPAPEQEPVPSAPPAEPQASYAADPTLNKKRSVAQPGVQPYPQWPQVIKRLQEVDPMLYGYLKRSKGYFDGTRVLIDGGRTFRDFIRVNKDSQKLIKKLIAEISGIAVPIGPYEPKAQKKAEQGDAEQALHSLEKLGLEVHIQDSEKPSRKKR